MNTTLRALVNQAERLVQNEAYQEAIALCQAILRRYPRYARCYRILGEAYLGLAEPEEAAKLFRRVLGVDPEDPVPYAGLAIIFEERGLLEEAIWQLERAFELAPSRDELRRELARLYRQRGSSARVQLTRAALARLYARGGLWNKALGELQELLAREPYRLDLRVTLARTLWRARRREEAARVAQAILDQTPNCLVARLILGTYWCQEGREEEGYALLQGAQELDPENREAARLLAGESPLRLREPHLEALEAVVDDLTSEETEAAWQGEAAEPAPAVEAAAETVPTAEEEPEAEAIVSPPSDESLQQLLARAAEAEEEPAEEAEAGEGPVLPESEGETEACEDGALVVEPGEEAPEPLSRVAVLRRRLEAAPDDREATLELARALVDEGRLDEALPLYDNLATPASGMLDRVLADLEAVAAVNSEHVGLRELMGDAYARAGRFQEAMSMYRWLLARDEHNDAAGGQ
jgi:tetratricopeptide (TPR) repeat protein